LRRVERDGSLITGEMEYVGEGWRDVHSFSARLLTEGELDEELRAAGLQRMRFLDEKRAWIEAVPLAGH
jgi:Arc/MetJ family transcription regulator